MLKLISKHIPSLIQHPEILFWSDTLTLLHTLTLQNFASIPCNNSISFDKQYGYAKKSTKKKVLQNLIFLKENFGDFNNYFQ